MFNSTDIITNIFHLVIFVGAITVFARAVLYRIGLVRKGQKVDKIAPLEGKLRSFLLYVVFQKKLFKHPARGVMHALIFYGFVAYLFHTGSQMIAGNAWAVFKANGVDPYAFLIPDYMEFLSFKGNQALIIMAGLIAAIGLVFLAHNKIKLGKRALTDQSPAAQWAFLIVLLGLLGGVFGVAVASGSHTYEAVVQFFSVFVLIGLAYFAGRRWILHSDGLTTPSPESAIVMYLIGTLMLSTLASSAASAVLDGGKHASIISVGTASILKAMGMTETSDAVAVQHFSWWLHLFTVYVFMMYVPTAKHAHLLFAPMNYFMARTGPRGQMRNMDLENATVYGAANLNELPWTSLLDGLSCIECGRCTVECPANRTGKPLDPRKIIVDIKHATMEHRKALEKTTDEAAEPSPVLGDPFITDEEIFSCTSCYACVEACPVGNNQLEAIMEMRRNLVLVESRFPSELQLAFNNMEKNSNPWGVAAHTRADWCAD
ncbi:MAG: (Fe-S)-binding protein, partial [Spirochaetia bacterium]|nr:(Fe-S)-binding protein [Spirochaetia bacterium]